MKYYYGSDKLLYIKLPSETEYLLAGCLTDNPMSEDSEFIPTSTRESQGWSTSKPIKQNYTLSFSGLQILTGADNGTPEMVSYDRLKRVKRLRGLIGWRLETIDKSLIDSGFAHVGTISEASPVDGWLTYDCTLIGYGKPEDIISNGTGTPTGGGENSGGNGGGNGGGGGGSNYNPNNRFRIIYMVDELDNVVSKIKTNYVNTFEIWSKNDTLFARFRDGAIPIPPAPRELDTVLYELYEGVGGEPFLELNMHFRGGANADYFTASSGIVGTGANRAKEGLPVSVELSYDGGELDGNGNVITPWDAPVRVTLTITKNGVNFVEPIVHDYPVPPATGVLFGSSFVPQFGENWLIVGKATRGSFLFTNNVIANVGFKALDVNNSNAVITNQVDHTAGEYNYQYLINNYEVVNVIITNSTAGSISVNRVGQSPVILTVGQTTEFVLDRYNNNNTTVTAL